MTHFLVGQKIALRPLRESDADGPYPSWLNDAEVSRFNSHGVYPYDREQAVAFIASARGRRDEIVLAIEDLATRVHIGNVALQSIHPINRSADFSILIGDRSFWASGVGADAGALLLRHAFDALGLHRVGCGTTDDNEGMKRLALKLHMREEGRRRQAAWSRGAWVDVLEYGVLADDFYKARA